MNTRKDQFALFLKLMALAVICMTLPNIGAAIAIVWFIRVVFFSEKKSSEHYPKGDSK